MITGKERQQQRGEKKGTILTGYALVAGVVGAVLGGIVGSLAGPAGIAWGAVLGMVIGGAIGATIKEPAPSVPNVDVAHTEPARSVSELHDDEEREPEGTSIR